MPTGRTRADGSTPATNRDRGVVDGLAEATGVDPGPEPDDNERAAPARGGKVDLAANDIRAVQLRMAGLSYEDIGREMGIARQTAFDAVKRAIRRWGSETVEEYRRLELLRLDKATAAVWPQVLRGDAEAIRTFLQIVDRRARLLGMYQPEHVNVGVLDASQQAAAPQGTNIVEVVETIARAVGADVAGAVIDVDSEEVDSEGASA